MYQDWNIYPKGAWHDNMVVDKMVTFSTNVCIWSREIALDGWNVVESYCFKLALRISGSYIFKLLATIKSNNDIVLDTKQRDGVVA